MEKKVSTEDLIAELSKRKDIELLNAGMYTSWELKGKYSKRNETLPRTYGILLIKDSHLLDKIRKCF